MSPLVSVIIPTYNRMDLLKEAVRSVTAQDFSGYEVLVIDDGSTDDTFKIQHEKGVRYLKVEHCGMAGKVRNIGAAEARGKYLAFLDSDDLWIPEKLSLQVSLMEENPELVLSHTREQWLRAGQTVSQRKQRHRREGDIFSDALVKCIIGPSTVMIRRDYYLETGGFREDLEIAEDYELWLRITSGQKVGYLDTPLTVKRAGDWDQLSEKYGQIEIFRIEALKNLVEKGFFHENRQKEAKAELCRKAEIYALGCRKRGRDAEAAEYEVLAEKFRE